MKEIEVKFNETRAQYKGRFPTELASKIKKLVNNELGVRCNVVTNTINGVLDCAQVFLPKGMKDHEKQVRQIVERARQSEK